MAESDFPITLSRSPGVKGYTETPDKNAVKVASAASGLPVVNKLFTFQPITFKHTLFLVSQVDKDTVMTHYEAYKDVPFNWVNIQDDNTYEVIYAVPPKLSLDKIETRWRIQLTFIQYSPL